MQLSLRDFIKRRLGARGFRNIDEFAARAGVSTATFHNTINRGPDAAGRQVPMNQERIATTLGYGSWKELLDEWRKPAETADEQRNLTRDHAALLDLVTNRPGEVEAARQQRERPHGILLLSDAQLARITAAETVDALADALDAVAMELRPPRRLPLSSDDVRPGVVKGDRSAETPKDSPAQSGSR